jgi:modification target Cys-rich repeat protein
MAVISKTSMDNVKNAINSARNRWGLAQDSPSTSVGAIATASYVNSLSSKLTEAKNKSGWTGGITTVTAGNKITDITGALITQANSIQNHCVCHGNCKGSCTGSCTGSCSGGCTSSCRDSCGTTCRQTCNDNCSERSR